MPPKDRKEKDKTRDQLQKEIQGLRMQLDLEQRLSGTYLQALDTISYLVRENTTKDYALSLNARALKELHIDFPKVQSKREEIQERDKREQEEEVSEAKRKEDLRRSLDPSMHG